MGFMIPTFLLSWCIVNTAATAAMLPLLEAVLDQLDPDLQKNYQLDIESKRDPKDSEMGDAETRLISGPSSRKQSGA